MNTRQALAIVLGTDLKIQEEDGDVYEAAMAEYYPAEQVLLNAYGREATENLSIWYTHWRATAEEVAEEGANPEKFDELVRVMKGELTV